MLLICQLCPIWFQFIFCKVGGRLQSLHGFISSLTCSNSAASREIFDTWFCYIDDNSLSVLTWQVNWKKCMIWHIAEIKNQHKLDKSAEVDFICGMEKKCDLCKWIFNLIGAVLFEHEASEESHHSGFAFCGNLGVEYIFITGFYTGKKIICSSLEHTQNSKQRYLIIASPCLVVTAILVCFSHCCCDSLLSDDASWY